MVSPRLVEVAGWCSRYVPPPEKLCFYIYSSTENDTTRTKKGDSTPFVILVEIGEVVNAKIHRFTVSMYLASHREIVCPKSPESMN